MRSINIFPLDERVHVEKSLADLFALKIDVGKAKSL